jgi:hypothetical protein
MVDREGKFSKENGLALENVCIKNFIIFFKNPIKRGSLYRTFSDIKIQMKQQLT